MSFEFDENKLANPPVKSDQEAITSFWGIYRWPYKKYNRYAQLEGLEQTADETRTMAKALRYISGATELGLSIDGGLGWLAGPDVNQRIIERGEKLVVFGEPRFVPEPRSRFQRLGKNSNSNELNMSTSNSNMYSTFERMLQEAGYRDENLEPSVRMMLETEETTSQGQSSTSWDNSTFTLDYLRRMLRREPSQLENTPASLTNLATLDENPLYATDDEEDARGVELTGQTILLGQPLLPGITFGKNKTKNETSTLKPNDLTNAQREMLLEIEWAQRAFMQSYAIAIIDNPSTFTNIKSLTIARLPNRHLPILRREDFWDSLPELQKLSLAIIPDWRDVVKLPTSWVQDIRLAPSQSLAGVYQILQEQISRRKNIKSLHFEWLCGGEYSPGLFSRNQHILAAPLVVKSMDMVNRSQVPPALRFPHLEDLSLRNCWISPHIMSRFVHSLKKSALQTFTLDSVSLTAALPQNAEPNPLAAHAANPQNAQQLAGQAAANNLMLQFQGLAQNAQQAQNPPAAPAAPAGNGSNEPEWLEAPRVGSWPDIIDRLTPSTTLADIRYSRDIGPEPEARVPTELSKIQFKSCGYVRLPLDFDQTSLDPPEVPAPQASTTTKRISDIDAQMMKPLDPTLGVIVNHIRGVEVATLENAWNMSVGWGIDGRELMLDAQLDGISHPGQGRFDGLIEVPRFPRPRRRST
jgi:hypothetical protein